MDSITIKVIFKESEVGGELFQFTIVIKKDITFLVDYCHAV